MSFLVSFPHISSLFFATWPNYVNLDVWAEWWTSANEKHPGRNEATYMGIYALFQGVCLIVLAILAW